MSKDAHRPATYDDILALPEHLTGEIVDGELFVSPRPSIRHANASAEIGGDIRRPFHRRGGGDTPGGWWIFPEPEIHLGPDVFVPDLAGWRRERVPTFPDVTAIEVAPDWVCEVLSPSNGRLDRFHKMPAYARHGVPWAWLVEPARRRWPLGRPGHARRGQGPPRALRRRRARHRPLVARRAAREPRHALKCLRAAAPARR